MKKAFILLGILMAFQPLFAQDTIGSTHGFQSFFGQEMTEWNGVIVDFDRYWGGLLRTGIDTVIDGTQYKKVEYSIADWFDGTYGESRSSDNDFYLREDTVAGKLWCRFPFFFPDTHPHTGEELSREALIVDMALSIGDTFFVFDPDWLDSFPCTVTDTMTIDHRRTIVLSCRDDIWPDEIKFIEGVGCTNLFLYAMLDDIGSYVTCCHRDGELVYHWRSRDDDSDCAPTIVGIENQENHSSISVYPNPCTDKVWIDGEDILSATLFDIRGNMLKTAIDPHQPLDMSTFSKGVYILRILTPAGPTTKKLLVQ